MDLGRQERSISWLLSAILHLSVMLVFGIFWRHEPKGTNVEADRGAGIVLVRNTNAKPEYFSGDSADSSGTKSATSTAAFSETETNHVQALPGSDVPPVNLAGMLPTQDGLKGFGGAGEGLPSANSSVNGSGKSGTGAGNGKAHTYVFGVQGTGSRFVYVFDRSASMDGFQGRPLIAAKRELIASVNSLEAIHQFQIVFYNERTSVFNPLAPQTARMMFGDDKNKRLAEGYVRSIVAEGGTHHMDALRMGLNLGPDVMFFLTDADEPQLTGAELAEIVRRNQRAATINSIQFGAGPDPGGDNFLKRLAVQNRGQHTYVDVTSLPR